MPWIQERNFLRAGEIGLGRAAPGQTVQKNRQSGWCEPREHGELVPPRPAVALTGTQAVSAPEKPRKSGPSSTPLLWQESVSAPAGRTWGTGDDPRGGEAARSSSLARRRRAYSTELPWCRSSFLRSFFMSGDTQGRDGPQERGPSRGSLAKWPSDSRSYTTGCLQGEPKDSATQTRNQQQEHRGDLAVHQVHQVHLVQIPSQGGFQA